MFFIKPLAVCESFITQINAALINAGATKLSCAQRLWLAICITGILITNTLCWEKFSRACFGESKANTMSKMFRRAKINWELLLQTSVMNIFEQYDIKQGLLVLDDTDNKRSKNTPTIYGAHKIKDKPSGGYVNGQELLFLVLVTDKLTIPVGFAFYEPDPDLKAWKKEDKKLRLQGKAKDDRPAKPEKNNKYPSKHVVAINLINQFKNKHSNITIQAILADALYGAHNFVSAVIAIYPKTQIISQVQSTQKVRVRNNYITVKEYFERNKGVLRKLRIRGGIEKDVVMHGARLYLRAHGCKRFIIALKYPGEEKYRYLLGTDLTWRLTDIAATYTLRWLVEVFIQDWKSYEGWCQLAKQPDIDGSSQGVILSLLLDHCLLLHPEQKALIDNKLPAVTVGSLRDQERAKAVVDAIEELLTIVDPVKIIKELKSCIATVIPLRQSSKHMSGRDLGRIGPTESLKYRAAA